VKKYILKFKGPFSFIRHTHPCIFEQDIAQDSGIYIWTIPYCQGGYIITYIGETGVSFYKRTKERFIQLIGGNYRILDSDSALKGELKELWRGMWRKGTRDKMPEYFEKLIEFAPKIVRLLKTQQIFLASFEAERNIRRKIEWAIAEHIKNQPLPASSLFPRDVRYYMPKDIKESLTVILECQSNIYGLPKKLNI
jgi:hypothetical protein